jgi:hypothetical protein
MILWINSFHASILKFHFWIALFAAFLFLFAQAFSKLYVLMEWLSFVASKFSIEWLS